MKERQKYENKLKKKQVKPIKSMSEREARCKRKQWRQHSKNYYKRKIEGQREPEMPDTPSSSDQEPDIVPVPVQVSSGRKRIHRDRSRVIQRNKKLIKENVRLKTLLAKYKQRYYRQNEKKAQNKDMTPRTKVKAIIGSKDRQLVKRKLLFGAALEGQLRSNFQNIKSFKGKKSFASTVIGNGNVLKRCKVVNGLSEIFTTRLANCKTTNGLKQRSEKKIVAELKENVRQFLEDDENSRQAPGKKDCITRKKIKKQKRYLNDTMKNLHKKFNNSVSYKISYALFCKFRPFWVVYQKPNQRDTCQCKIHSNTSFLITALKRNNVISAKTPKEVAEELCCEGYKIPCLLRTCSKCKENEVSFNEIDGNAIIQYYSWVLKKEEYRDKHGNSKSVKHTIKIQKVSTALDLVNNLKEVMLKFMKHEAIIKNQYAQLGCLKLYMQDDEALVHCDFSENYSLKYSEEIQSFHFGGSRQQVSLHTTSVFYKENNFDKCKTKSFCTFSENLNHGPPEILAHLEPVFKVLNSLKPNLRILHFLSDSPSNQYRNKLIFFLFSHLIKEYFPNLQLSTWNYYEAGHGKGTPDGIGGTIKRTADRLVSEGKDVDTFDRLFQLLKENIHNIDTYAVTDEDIQRVKEKINVASVLPFIGTMTVHQVINTHAEPCVLQMKSLSCFTCIDKHRDNLQSYECTHNTIGKIQYPLEDQPEIDCMEGTSKAYQLVLPGMQQENKPQAEGRRKKKETYVTGEDKPGKYTAQSDKVVYWKDLQPGNFILVKFHSTGKTRNTYRYACIVQGKDDDDGEVFVQGLKLLNAKSNEFIVNDKDLSSVKYEDIVQNLDEPTIVLKNGRQIVYKFKKSIDVFEKC